MSSSGPCNRGFAFVNFKSVETAKKFSEAEWSIHVEIPPKRLSCLLSECSIVAVCCSMLQHVAAVSVFGCNSSKDFANKQVVDCFPEGEGEKVACLANGIPSATE